MKKLFFLLLISCLATIAQGQPVPRTKKIGRNVGLSDSAVFRDVAASDNIVVGTFYGFPPFRQTDTIPGTITVVNPRGYWRTYRGKYFLVSYVVHYTGDGIEISRLRVHDWRGKRIPVAGVVKL
jgi:hypothetical protein